MMQKKEERIAEVIFLEWNEGEVVKFQVEGLALARNKREDKFYGHKFGYVTGLHSQYSKTTEENYKSVCP